MPKAKVTDDVVAVITDSAGAATKITSLISKMTNESINPLAGFSASAASGIRVGTGMIDATDLSRTKEERRLGSTRSSKKSQDSNERLKNCC